MTSHFSRRALSGQTADSVLLTLQGDRGG